MGVRVKSPDGVSRQLSVCYKNGSCTNNEPQTYQASLKNSDGQAPYILVLEIFSVSRNDNNIQCTTDGIVSGQCILDVYVTPQKPVCELPRFIENGTVIYVKCTADGVYPSGVCQFTLQDEVKDAQTSHQGSSGHPGNKEVICELRMPVRDQQPGVYLLQAEVKADVPQLTENDFVKGNKFSVELSEVALGKGHSANETFEVAKGSSLKKTFQITGNPHPIGSLSW